MRSSILVALVVLGCHRETAPGAPASTAEADALWALTPEGATIGIVASPRAITMTEHGWQDVRAFLAAAPELAPAREAIESALASAHLGNGTLADAGLAPGKGFAVIGTTATSIMVIPVADRDKFLAVAKGTKGTDFDTLDKAHCKTVQGYYICAEDDALFGKLGKGKLVDKLAGTRGDIEFVGQDLPIAGGRSAVVAVAQLARGGVVVRGSVTGIPADTTKMFGAPVKPRADVDRTAGFGAFDPRGLLANVPDVPLLAGVTSVQLVKTIAGPITLAIPAGVPVFDGRIPLSDPGPAKTLVEHCTDFPPLAAIGAKIVDGACHFSIPNMNAEGDLWVEGKELRFGKRGAMPGGEAVPMTDLGKELARGEWTLAMWGRGTMYAPVNIPGQTFALPPEAAGIVRAVGMFDEAGLGVKIEGTTVKFVFGLRTAWSNPDDVVAKIEAINPEDVLAAKAGDAGKAIAAAAPNSPFAADFKAGYQGLMVPVAAIGVVAAVAVPAFVDYTKKSKKSEAALRLNQIARLAKVYYAENAALPAGDVAPPATCCGKSPDNKCPVDPKEWQQAPWKALEFAGDEPSAYRYGYHSDGKSFTAVAVSDLDCDGTDATWTLHGEVNKDTNNLETTLTPPPTGTY